MNRIYALLAAGLGAVVPALATVVMTTETTPIRFDLDTRSHAYPVTSRTEAVGLPYGEDATVTVTAPGGAVTTLDPAVNGTNWWTATAGGVWTLTNSREGTACFAVRYEGAEQGSGTVASPWKFVDNDELSELSVADGFTFATEGPLASIANMERPGGYAFLVLGDGLYQTIVSSGGVAYMTANSAFLLDTEREGPDRRGRKANPWPDIAYTGDGWVRAAAASTLTLTPPGEAASATEHIGSGTVPFAPHRTGFWTVALAYGTTTLSGQIEVVPDATMMIVR